MEARKYRQIINALHRKIQTRKDQDPPSHKGKLIIDATVAEQAIRYPTNLGLLIKRDN